MVTTPLESFKIQQRELHRQAAEYRLVSSSNKPWSWTARATRVIGEMLIAAGQELQKSSRVAH